MISPIHEAIKLLYAYARRGEGRIDEDDIPLLRKLAGVSGLSQIQVSVGAKAVRKYLLRVKCSAAQKVALCDALAQASAQTSFEVKAISHEETKPEWDVEKAQWGPTKIMVTSKGRKLMKQAFIPPSEWTEFFREWRKGQLGAKGYRFHQGSGSDYYIQHWSDLPEEDSQKYRQEETLAFNHVPDLREELAAQFEIIKDKLLDYQHGSVKRLVAALDGYHGAIDASDTGTGKTYATLAACAILGKKAFVICPKAVVPSWRGVAAHFGVRLAGVIGYEKLRTGNTEYGKIEKEYIGTRPIKQKDRTTKEVKQFKLTKFEFSGRFLPKDKTIVVWDEIHRVKNTESQNSLMAISSITQGYDVLGLSATAADNPTQMKFVALLTGLITTPNSFGGWKAQNAVTQGTIFTGGRDVLHRIHSQIFPIRGTRIRIADLGDAFPPTKIMAENVDFDEQTESIKQVYQDMQMELAKLQERKSKDSAANMLVVMLRARQMVELLKVPTMCSMVKDAIEEGMAVAVILNFSDTIKAFSDRLKCNCIIQGGQKDYEREGHIQDFQADREKCILLNIRAGGVGVSLHGGEGKRTRLALISPTYSGQDLKQALGRVHRAGGARSLQKIVFAAGTIEEEACRKVKEKLERIASFNDGPSALTESELEAALTIN